MPNPLIGLHELGQSIWLDYIRRDLFDGELQRLIDEDGLAGMTSNPTIFDKAISDTELYDDDIREMGPDTEPAEVFVRLAVADVQRAADHFRPLFDRTLGREGFVSIEVNPHLARDTERTQAAVRRLWEECDRPNVMVKIPGTEEGLPAIRQSLAEGININITLLFSVERYLAVMDAWFDAFEERVAAGRPVDRLASVASFFVSRVDSMVDERLKDHPALKHLAGKIGIDNARIAYQKFEQRFGDGRYSALEEAGARLQRPLWASTSTKNPELPDIYYVEALIAAETVNTLPPDTLEAYRDHGDPAVRIHDDLDGAHRRLEELSEAGIDFSAITRALEDEGLEKFARSYDDLLATIEEDQRAVLSA